MKTAFGSMQIGRREEMGIVEMNAYIPYVAIAIFFIIYSTMLLTRLSRNLGSEHEVFELRNMLYAFIVLCAADVFWALFQGEIIEGSQLARATADALMIAAVTSGCYFWFKFVEDRLKPAYSLHKNINKIIAIPVIVICALDIISIFTGWMFVYDENGVEEMTWLFSIQSIFNYSYLLIPTINAAYKAIKANSKFQRTEYITYVVYMLAPVIGSLFEDVMPTVPIIELFVFMVILLLFITIQNSQIFNDALTDLNNRRRLDQYLSQRIEAASPKQPVLFFIMDINRFKAVNDTYGHVEGDSALKLFAKALRMVAGKHNAFIARYGGDEFCIVSTNPELTPEIIENSLQEALDAVQSQAPDESKLYTLSASVGYSKCEDPDCRIDALIKQADDMLYQNKRDWRMNNL